MKPKIHAFAGGLGLLTICIFWTATVASEVFGSIEHIVLVKGAILRGMVILIPALAVAGASGFALGGKWKSPLVARKKRRMKFIAGNGLLILLPSAFFLATRAQAQNFDEIFVAVQAVEIIAGAVNITLMSLNMRDGIALSKRKTAATQSA